MTCQTLPTEDLVETHCAGLMQTRVGRASALGLRNASPLGPPLEIIFYLILFRFSSVIQVYGDKTCLN